MKRILLIGDSIRQGYDKYVKLAFKGRAEVVFPNENCRSSAYVLRSLFFWKDWLKLDSSLELIHWNAGLWDSLCLLDGRPLISIEQYRDNIERICFHMDKLFPNAKMIFATSTPVQEKLFTDCKRYNCDIEKYNEAACEIVRAHGGYINDLYSLMNACPVEYHSDLTHYYTMDGTRVITNAVVESICGALGENVEKLDFDRCYNRVDEFLGL